MGYDDGECVYCYLTGRGNNPTICERFVCSVCIERLATKAGSLPRRVAVVLGARTTTGGTTQKCFLCAHERYYGSDVSVCDDKSDDGDNVSHRDALTETGNYFFLDMIVSE